MRKSGAALAPLLLRQFIRLRFHFIFSLARDRYRTATLIIRCDAFVVCVGLVVSLDICWQVPTKYVDAQTAHIASILIDIFTFHNSGKTTKEKKSTLLAYPNSFRFSVSHFASLLEFVFVLCVGEHACMCVEMSKISKWPRLRRGLHFSGATSVLHITIAYSEWQLSMAVGDSDAIKCEDVRTQFIHAFRMDVNKHNKCNPLENICLRMCGMMGALQRHHVVCIQRYNGRVWVKMCVY